MRVLFIALSALVAASGCKGDCDEESCDSWCDGFDDPDAPGQSFQTCVQGASAAGGDLVLRDESGEEVYRCTDEYDELGQEVGSCTTDFAQAKFDYCGCGTSVTGYTFSTYY